MNYSAIYTNKITLSKCWSFKHCRLDGGITPYLYIVQRHLYVYDFEAMIIFENIKNILLLVMMNVALESC